MKPVKTSVAIFSALISTLFLLSLLSGCSVVGSAPPINVTIHSAYITKAIGDQLPKPGTVFVVVNMTFENRGDATYIFDNTSAVITNGRLINGRRFAKIKNHGYWGPIPPHAQRTGEVIFGASADTQDFTITFLYNGGKDSFDRHIGSIPVQDGPSPSGSQSSGSQAPGAAVQENGATGRINVTINSFYTTTSIQGSRPYAGKMFVVTDMTIENPGDTNFTFTGQNVQTTGGGGPLTEKLYNVLTNPLVWGPVPAHETKQGQVVFSVLNTTQKCTITIMDDRKQVIFEKDLDLVP